jgi:type II secretory pathway pseudopilin PulG
MQKNSKKNARSQRRRHRAMRPASGFSLLELVLVGALIALFIGMLLPTCAMMRSSRKYNSDERAVADMSVIQAGFRRCHADCKLTNDDMTLFARFGAWPLLLGGVPTGKGVLPPPGPPAALEAADLAAFAAVVTRISAHSADGRSPYLINMAAETFETAAEAFGQKSEREAGGFIAARTLPVFTDPWSKDYNPDETTGLSYYRFLIPCEPDGSASYPGRITLICTGPNGKLDTKPTDIDEFTKEIRARKDDLALRLLPREAAR